MKRGLFIGRFQPFHLGHLSDIKNAFKEVDELAIGIGSSNEKHTKENPFTVEERTEMIDSVLPNNGISNYTVFPMIKNGLSTLKILFLSLMLFLLEINGLKDALRKNIK